jgi:hypothetical protein
MEGTSKELFHVELMAWDAHNGLVVILSKPSGKD